MKAMIEAKKCSKCGQVKAIYDFYANPNHSDGLRSECKKCYDGYAKEYRAIPAIKQKQKKQHAVRNKCSKEVSLQERICLKREIINAYGGQCQCCGEKEIVFLCIDHINGNGTKHRNKVGGNSNLLYRWLRKNNYPDGFQVLCFNCNRAKHFLGTCPHQSPPL